MIETKTASRAPAALATTAAFALTLVLSGCSYPDWANPIEWYRDATGVSQDDPDGTEPNAKNLEKGSEEPYPSVGTVPAPPTNALSSEEREQLKQSLVSDRANAKYVDNSDQYSATAPQAVAGPVASPPASAGNGSTPSSTSSQSTASASGGSTFQPTSAGPAPRTTAVPATTAAGPPGASNSPSVAAEQPQRQPPRRIAGSPSTATQPQSQESSLTPPAIANLPQGDQPRTAPPAPGTAAQPAAARTPPQTSPQSPPQPPPQTASLQPPANVRTAPIPMPPQGLSMTIGVVRFAPNSTRIGADELQQIRQAAQLRQQNGGNIRVTVYSMPSGARDAAAAELDGFALAMDRARAVAVALTNAGVPARSIETGAAPASVAEDGGVAALTLEY
jgi:outer membrane protein OmpA-like peptidoglycan-associated protein